MKIRFLKFRPSVKKMAITLLMVAVVFIMKTVYQYSESDLSLEDDWAKDSYRHISAQNLERKKPSTDEYSSIPLFGPSRVPNVPEELFSETVFKRKYFIFICDGTELFCGGYADRQEGIVAAYILSQILGRIFGIKFTVPCDITNYLLPNQVDWTIKPEDIAGLTVQRHVAIDEAAFHLREQMVSMDLVARYPADVVYFNVNQEFVQYLQLNPKFQSLKWGRNRTVSEIYNIVLRRLFKLKPEVQQKFVDFQTRVRKNGRKLVCAHIRLRYNPTMPDDFRPPKSFEVDDIFTFLKTYNISSLYQIFIAADSEDVRDRGKKLFSLTSQDIEGRIVHVELTKGNHVCAGFEKVILDQMVLSTCDTLVITKSGLNRIATFLRGTDEDIYCAKLTKIEKCFYNSLNFIPYNW